MVTTFKRLRNIAVGTALIAASTGAFAAAAPFVVNPNATLSDGSTLSPITSTFTADVLNGISSAQISQVGNSFNYIGQGYIQYNGLSMGSSTLGANITGLNFYYGLYATFTQTFACSGMLGTGTSCQVTSISLSLYADKGNNDTFTAASTTSLASVTNTAGDIKLGSVTQVLSGSAGVDAQGGAFQNVNTNFVLTADGSAYFVNPTPFYSFAFSAFNNTSQGLTCLPDCNNISVMAINSESGITDFNAVPEPMPLALMGLGMLGMVALRRKQAKK